MSTTPYEGGEPETVQRSSVKLTRNAKGDTQAEVKVYAGDTEEDVARARRLAVETYKGLVAEFNPGAAA